MTPADRNRECSLAFRLPIRFTAATKMRLDVRHAAVDFRYSIIFCPVSVSPGKKRYRQQFFLVELKKPFHHGQLDDLRSDENDRSREEMAGADQIGRAWRAPK